MAGIEQLMREAKAYKARVAAQEKEELTQVIKMMEGELDKVDDSIADAYNTAMVSVKLASLKQASVLGAMMLVQLVTLMIHERNNLVAILENVRLKQN